MTLHCLNRLTGEKFAVYGYNSSKLHTTIYYKKDSRLNKLDQLTINFTDMSHFHWWFE